MERGSAASSWLSSCVRTRSLDSLCQYVRDRVAPECPAGETTETMSDALLFACAARVSEEPVSFYQLTLSDCSCKACPDCRSVTKINCCFKPARFGMIGYAPHLELGCCHNGNRHVQWLPSWAAGTVGMALRVRDRRKREARTGFPGPWDGAAESLAALGPALKQIT